MSVLFFLNSSEFKAQNSDLESGIFNVGVGSVLGGIGAIINKEPGEKFGKTLLKGMGQGALGGYLVFESERLIRQFSRSGDYNYVWPSKIVNSAGTSIIENAAANRDFWARWHMNIGFNRIEVNTKENFKLSYRILPFSLVETVFAATSSEFDLKTSVKVGTFVFRQEQILGGYVGYAPANVVVLLKGFRGDTALPHELIHTYQYERTSGFNNFFTKAEKSISSKLGMSEIYSLYNKIFYNDYNYVLNGILYVMADTNGHANNFFEDEARYFSRHSGTMRIRAVTPPYFPLNSSLSR